MIKPYLHNVYFSINFENFALGSEYFTQIVFFSICVTALDRDIDMAPRQKPLYLLNFDKTIGPNFIV